MFAEIQQSVNYKTDCWLLTVDLRKKLKIESSKFLQFEKKTAGAFYFCLIEMNCQNKNNQPKKNWCQNAI